jgi:hypothetical protein
MKMTMNEFFDQFPINRESLARSMNVSKQWVNAIVIDKTPTREELKRKNILSIQDHIQQQGDVLYNIKLNSANFHKLLPATPFSYRLLSQAINMPSNAIDKLLETPIRKRNPDIVLSVQNQIRTNGTALRTVVITDYIEHDEIARALQPFKGRFNGIII